MNVLKSFMRNGAVTVFFNGCDISKLFTRSYVCTLCCKLCEMKVNLL